MTYSELVQWLRDCPVIPGVNLSYIMELPDPLKTTLQKMLRGPSLTLGQFAKDVEFPLAETEVLTDIMVEKGYLIINGEEGADKTTFRVHLARTRGHSISIDF